MPTGIYLRTPRLHKKDPLLRKAAKKAYDIKYRAKNRTRLLQGKIEWSATHKDRVRETQHQNRYNEPLQNKINRLEAQGYKCANQACLVPIDITTGHQDHNHDTGEKRGILCRDCNLALGMLNDDADKAIGLGHYKNLFKKGEK